MASNTIVGHLLNPIGYAVNQTGGFKDTAVGSFFGGMGGDIHNVGGILGAIHSPWTAIGGAIGNGIQHASDAQKLPTPPPPPAINPQDQNVTTLGSANQEQGSAATQLAGTSGADTTLATTYSAGRTLLGN